jgi:hypothetical protein
MDTPARELAALLAGNAAHREREHAQIAALAAAAEPQALAAELERQRLLPILGGRLVEAIAAPPRLAELVGDARRVATLRGMAFDAHTTRVVRAIDGAGIPVLRLKGTALSARLYGDPGFRQSNDVDVLVPRERLADAVAALSPLGYECEPGPELPVLHHVLTHPEPAHPDVDLHWRIHWYEEAFSARLLERSEPGAGGERVADPADELVALLLFYARDGLSGLRFPTDIGAFGDVLGAAVDRAEVGRVFAAYPEVAVPARAALRAAARLGADGVVPAGALSRRQGLAVRIADPALAADVDQLVANVHLVDGLLMPRGELRGFLRRQRSARDTPAAALLHLGKLAGRWLLALARLALRRS